SQFFLEGSKVSELEMKRKVAEHYKALANQSDDPDRKAHYDREFERAARDYNRLLMRGRR
ncbi:hypothetical protein EBZ39_14730, partial [bacterium]|nr:hypothetical protein [bacterium]